MAGEDPLSLELIQDQLRAAVNDQTRLTALYHDVARKAADAEATYKVAFARERWAAKSADGKKVNDTTAEDIARDATDDLYRDYLLADAERDAIKQALFSNREKQQTLRTLASSYRMLELGGS
jgi:oligoribonuclease NrnB/cAMP/cGMP phosphodiesterase (DHH superfamily)